MLPLMKTILVPGRGNCKAQGCVGEEGAFPLGGLGGSSAGLRGEGSPCLQHLEWVAKALERQQL